MKLPKNKRNYLAKIGYTEAEILAIEENLDGEVEKSGAVIMKLKNGEFMRAEKDEFDVMKLIFATKKSLLLKSILGE